MYSHSVYIEGHQVTGKWQTLIAQPIFAMLVVEFFGLLLDKVSSV